MIEVLCKKKKNVLRVHANTSTAHGVLFIKYASILLQAITVQIDEAFLYAVLDLTKLEGVSWDTDEDRYIL